MRVFCWIPFSMLIFLVSLYISATEAFVVSGGVKGYRSASSSSLLYPTELRAVAKKSAAKKKAAPKKKKKTAAKTTATKKKVSAVDNFKKSEFISALCETTGQSKKEAEDSLQAVLNILREQVNAGKKVALPGFGSFKLRERSARKGRNPQTGEELDIAASVSPGFTVSKTWKDEANGR